MGRRRVARPTVALLWTLFDDTRLSVAAKEILLDDPLDIFASVTNLCEISLKFGIGKLDRQGVAPEDLPLIAERECGIETLPLSVGLVTTFHQLPRTGHKDPFDRLIIWQAIREDLVLISKDDKMEPYRRDFGLKTFW